MEENVFEQRIDLSHLSKAVIDIRSEIGRVIVGQYKMVDLLMIGLLCDLLRRYDLIHVIK